MKWTRIVLMQFTILWKYHIFIQVKDIRKDEDSYYSENYDFGNLFNLISNDDYDNLKQIYDGLITNYIAVMNHFQHLKVT